MPDEARLREARRLLSRYPGPVCLALEEHVANASAGDRMWRLALEQRLLALCQPCLDDPWAAQSRLCRRLENHIKERFVFVAEPQAPPDNNAAQRSRRHLVVSLKVSGGTRSAQGTDIKITLASIFGAWRAQGLNSLSACRQLLVSPQL